jgi:hydroxymethylpyrimidine pyrophosphatase-like HAD family hydrolase
MWYHFQFAYRENYIISNEIFDEEVNNGDCYKVMVFYGFGKSKKTLSKDINKILREKHPDIESSWTSIVNELTPVNCNKGAGLEFYTNYLGIDKNDVYVVGDSGNDITMFNKFHEHSYCMNHAYPSVKKYAKYTISRVHNLRKLVLKGENK